MDQPDISTAHDRIVRGGHTDRAPGCGADDRLTQPDCISHQRQTVSILVRGALSGQLIEGFVGGIDDGVRAVPGGWGITSHVIGIEKIGFGAAGAGNPLPAQMIACQVAVQQMGVKPVCTRPPVHFTHMDEIARQPHARMVVQHSGGIERSDRLIDHRNAGASLSDIVGYGGQVGIVRQQPVVQGAKDRVAPVLPDMPEIRSPAELEDKLVLDVQRLARVHASQHIGERDNAVSDVGRQAADRAVKRVSSARIGRRPHCGDACPGCRNRRRKGLIHGRRRFHRDESWPPDPRSHASDRAADASCS